MKNGTLLLLMALIAATSGVTWKANAGGCAFELLRCCDAKVGRGGIARAKKAPINPDGWKRVSQPFRGVQRKPTFRESSTIGQELEKIRTIFGQDSIPITLEFRITTGLARHETSSDGRTTIFIQEGEIYNDVLWHEIGHSISNHRGVLGQSDFQFDASYDELFADTVALLKNDTITEIKLNGGAFVEGILPKGWVDHEEHQSLIPSRSAIGDILVTSGISRLTLEQKKMLGNTVLITTENAYRNQVIRARSNRAFPEPEEANVDLIAKLQASIRF